ncbi:hypothetical protein J2T13_004131 [Paenibacillus sp. DS2015]|uniref:hypothetical protein n=1 Tax=Paenibacillus sp. DS2015 TaxID=3373917 RepID=UPI003D2506E3
MNLTEDTDRKETHIEKKTDNSAVLMTFIKYAAYIIIFFGFIWFIVTYLLPMFN